MRNNNNMKNDTKYSSYWLRGDLFDDNSHNNDTKADTKNSNLVALASYKRAIGNFVSIVTNENIKVMFDQRGDNSYTDGKTVTISAKMDDKEFDSTVGLALHEGSHIKLTDFSTLETINNSSYPSPLTFDYIESLEHKHSMNYYTVRGWISGVVKDLVNVIEDRRIDYYIYSTSPGYQGYYQSMYDKYFNASIIDKGLKSDECRTNDWESYMFRIINITNANRDLDALPKLREVFNMIDLKNISRLENTREVLQLACEIFKLIEDSLPPTQTQSSNQPESGEGEDGESNSSEGDGSGNSKPSTTNGTDNTDGNGGEAKDGSNDTDETKGDAEGGDVKSGKSSYNPNGAGGDSNSGIADSKDESLPSLSDRQKKQLESAIKKQKKFQNGEITKNKLSKAENEKLDTLSKSGIDSKVVGKEYENNSGYWGKSNPVSVTIVRNFTKQLVDTDMFYMLSSYEYRTSRNQESINKGIQIGTMLGRKLKLRSEERSLTTPRMKNGKISGRLLHELGMGNVNIFDQTLISSHKPVLVHISIDASSSMDGKKWSNTQTSAVAIAKAASMTSNLDVVISYRSTQGDTPLMLIAYDSRKDKFSKIQQLFKYLNSSGTTPEGLCFESVLDEITKTSKGVDSYFINFSDGYPGFSNRDMRYEGDSAIQHTASQIKKMKQSGINVLSYFISDGYYGSGLDNFKEMYGKSAEVVDVTSVIPLAKTLNKLFQ
jgi:hypothetical protein